MRKRDERTVIRVRRRACRDGGRGSCGRADPVFASSSTRGVLKGLNNDFLQPRASRVIAFEKSPPRAAYRRSAHELLRFHAVESGQPSRHMNSRIRSATRALLQTMAGCATQTELPTRVCVPQRQRRGTGGEIVERRFPGFRHANTAAFIGRRRMARDASNIDDKGQEALELASKTSCAESPDSGGDKDSRAA